MLTEFGGVAFSNGAKSNGTKTWGYTMVNSEAEFIELFHQLLHTVIHTALFSGFCYTQFTDTFQEANGLLYRRSHAKSSFGADR